MIDSSIKNLSIREQCALLSVNRSTFYYTGCSTSLKLDTEIANDIHAIWMEKPFYGYRKITAELRRKGHFANGKKVLRLMNEMNIEAIYPRPRTSIRALEHKIYPYLLKGLTINRPNQVWSTDITYLKMSGGFVYLVALIDVFSRYIISWKLSNTLDVSFCLDMLVDAFNGYQPEILNTDQGCQFTSEAWVTAVQNAGVKVSMDGKGRWADNIFIERFWRTLKYEFVFLENISAVVDLRQGLSRYIPFYNNYRLHQSLGYKTPAEVFYSIRRIEGGVSKVPYVTAIQ